MEQSASLFCFSLSEANTLPQQDREKLGAKAVKEEFHGIKWPEGPYKLLYGWGTIYPSVWLPSLCELVGYDPNNYYEPYGCYNSAMQGLNTTAGYNVDNKGGTQFTYFQQYNTSGGGEKIMNACNREQSWTRSVCCWNNTNAWRITDPSNLNTASATVSHIGITGSRAVHPAVLYNP